MLRAFRGTFLVAIDDEEMDEGRAETAPIKPTLSELKSYLHCAAKIDWDNENYGNPVGVTSMELGIEALQELTEAEVKELYGK
jgi:hypothetical protein